MPTTHFYTQSIPDERIPSLILTGSYSNFYPTDKPAVPLAGDWRERNCCLADSFTPVLEPLFNFDVRDDDVFIVTSTKCGTTWTQEMVWLILNNFDYKTALADDLTIRSPFLEVHGVVPNMEFNPIDVANGLKSPRLIKQHLPSWLLPKQLWEKKTKLIYVFRNPKDAAISYYHHWRGMVGYKGSKEDFMHHYIDGYLNFNPFWPHVLDFWQMRNEDNVFFTSYERMKRDLGGVIKDVCRFLGKDISAEQLAQLQDHLSFDKMKNNSSCNHEKEFKQMQEATGVMGEEFKFIRRGIVGSHKDELSSNIIHEFDEWSEQNLKQNNLTLNDIINYSKY